MWISEVISSFRGLRAGSEVCVLLMLFLCVILHTMWSGKSLQFLCILRFDILCLPAIIMMLVNIIFAVCMLLGLWSERKQTSVSSVNCAQSDFL